MNAARRDRKQQHQILVTKDKLTTRSFSPSSQELFDLMHLTSCSHAIQRWKSHWMICPVCNAVVVTKADERNVEGVSLYVGHKEREEILV